VEIDEGDVRASSSRRECAGHVHHELRGWRQSGGAMTQMIAGRDGPPQPGDTALRRPARRFARFLL